MITNTACTVHLLAAFGTGLRANTFVLMGAAMFVLLSINVTKNSNGEVTARIRQVATGIGLRYAGIVFQ